MIISFDIETTPIESGKKPIFKLGCILIEGREKGEIYYNKEEMWQRIIELGIKEHKKKKTLTAYAHNTAFDFFNIADLNDPKIKYFCQNPFIVSYKHEGREIIKFLDTWSIYRMPLAKMAELLKMEKWDTPLEILGKPMNTPEEVMKIAAYCEQDCKITLKGITHLKEILKKEGIQVRRLYTINQIAINYLINVLRINNEKNVLMDIQQGKVWETYRKEEILEAYRGGRNETFIIVTIPFALEILAKQLPKLWSD